MDNGHYKEPTSIATAMYECVYECVIAMEARRTVQVKGKAPVVSTALETQTSQHTPSLESSDYLVPTALQSSYNPKITTANLSVLCHLCISASYKTLVDSANSLDYQQRVGQSEDLTATQ